MDQRLAVRLASPHHFLIIHRSGREGDGDRREGHLATRVTGRSLLPPHHRGGAPLSRCRPLHLACPASSAIAMSGSGAQAAARSDHRPAPAATRALGPSVVVHHSCFHAALRRHRAGGPSYGAQCTTAWVAREGAATSAAATSLQHAVDVVVTYASAVISHSTTASVEDAATALAMEQAATDLASLARSVDVSPSSAACSSPPSHRRPHPVAVLPLPPPPIRADSAASAAARQPLHHRPHPAPNYAASASLHERVDATYSSASAGLGPRTMYAPMPHRARSSVPPASVTSPAITSLIRPRYSLSCSSIVLR